MLQIRSLVGLESQIDPEDLTVRAAQLEKEADEHLILQRCSGTNYMQRLHGELADSLRFEASMLTQQRDLIVRMMETEPDGTTPADCKTN
jgi:hypothetical protein